MAAFTSTNSPLSDLIARYLGTGFSIVMLLCMAVSFFTSTLGCVNAGARVLFTMSRDGMLCPSLGRVNRKKQYPYVGLNVFVAVITMMIAVSFRLEAIQLASYAAITGNPGVAAFLYLYLHRRHGLLLQKPQLAGLQIDVAGSGYYCLDLDYYCKHLSGAGVSAKPVYLWGDYLAGNRNYFKPEPGGGNCPESLGIGE